MTILHQTIDQKFTKMLLWPSDFKNSLESRPLLTTALQTDTFSD